MGITKPQSIEERFRSLGLWQHRVKHRFNLREFARAGFFFEDTYCAAKKGLNWGNGKTYTSVESDISAIFYQKPVLKTVEKVDINDDPGRLRCAFCPAVIGNWQPEDDPWTEHALSVDYCPHVTLHKGEEFIERVKKEEEELAEITDHLDDSMNLDETNYELHLEQTSMGLFGMTTNSMRREQNVDSSINGGQSLEGVTRCNSYHQCGYHRAHGNFGQKLGCSDRNMDCKESRLSSFDPVRHLFENERLLNQIVESGFYFEGIDTYGIKVRCYRCSLALYDICENDDLWRIHAQMSNCAHVRERKGQDFIQEVQAVDTVNNQETVPSSDCRAKKRKQCESIGGNFDTGMSKNPFAQRPIPCQEHQPKISCTHQPVAGMEPDTKKLRIHPSAQNKKHGMENQLTTRQSVLSKEQDAKKLCTNRSMQNGEHDREKQLTLQSVLSEEQDAKRLRTHQSTQNKEQDRDNQVTRQSVFSKEHDAKKMCPHQSMRKNKQHCTEEICTHRSVQCKNHDTYVSASGRKRRPRYCSYNGRWCLIKWRSLVASRSFCRQRDSDRESGCTSSDTHRGTVADEVVFLCCDLKLCGRNGGQGPCPNCFQNKHVRSCLAK